MKNTPCKNEKLFGTDGIRGTLGTYPLTDGMIFKIGAGIAKLLSYKRQEKEKPTIVIGRDTRTTGKRLETILTDAITFYNIDVYLAGVITAAGVSFLVRELSADCGIMISASHNRPQDNGIKVFNAQGQKLTPQEEEWIEDIVFSSLMHIPHGLEEMHKGKTHPLRGVQSRYIHFLLSTLTSPHLGGIEVVLDCAWGASAVFSQKLFKRAGATVFAVNDTPQGEDINKGGPQDPAQLVSLVQKRGADIGIGFDGDGDRVVLIDEKGGVLDGDDIMAIMAASLMKKDKLAQNTIVTTELSNTGLIESLDAMGGKVIICKSGDKYVLQTLLKYALNFGGEQSGHIIFFDYLPSPSGLLTALQILGVMRESGLPLSALRKRIVKVPQVHLNIKVKEKKPLGQMPAVQKKLRTSAEQLKEQGRIFLHYSDTEPVARLMVEGRIKETISAIAEELASEIRREIGVEVAARDRHNPSPAQER